MKQHYLNSLYRNDYRNLPEGNSQLPSVKQEEQINSNLRKSTYELKQL